MYTIITKFGWASPSTVGKLLMPQLNWLTTMMNWQAEEQTKAERKANAKAKSRRR